MYVNTPVHLPQSVSSLWSHYRERLRDRQCSPPACAPAGWTWPPAAHHRQRRTSADLSPAPWNAGRADWWSNPRWRTRRSPQSCVRGCGLLASANLGPRRCTRQSLRRSFREAQSLLDIAMWVQAFTCVCLTWKSDCFYLYPMSSQPLTSWWKCCMERMSAEHCWKVRQGWLGVCVWWMYMKERGRDRLVGVPLYGSAAHMQRGMMGGQPETHSW